MSFVGFQPNVYDRLGGLYSFLFAEDIPDGFAVVVQNIRFLPGGIKSRSVDSGSTELIPLPTGYGSSYFAGIAEFTTNQSQKSIVSIDDLSNVFQSTVGLTNLIARKVADANATLTTSQQNNRIYLAFSKPSTPQGGVVPAGPIRQWDGTFLNPFCHPGPGSRYHGTYSQGSLTSGSQTITNVTYVNTWAVGDYLVDADGAIKGQVTAVNYDINTITVDTIGGATATVASTYLSHANPAVGNAVATGQVVAGYHGISVAFVTRSLYTTKPTWPVFIKASGSKQLTISNIPTGSSDVVARRIYLTAANGLDFYFLPQFQINDNTTTLLTVDFSDTQLLASTLVNDQFSNFNLPDAACVHSYAGSTVVWGALNIVPFSNLGFDGGTDLASGQLQPLAWIPGAASAGGT